MKSYAVLLLLTFNNDIVANNFYLALDHNVKF